MNDNELKHLIELYMAGQTTVDDEQRLAEHFRNNDVGEDMAAYKAMFAWFDCGMPLDNGEPEIDASAVKKPVHSRHRTLTVSLLSVAAAVIALLLLLTLTQNGGKDTAQRPLVSHSTASVTTATADTLTADTTTEKQPKSVRKQPRQRRNPYLLPHPVTLMAQAERDSIDKIANRLADERLRQIDRQQALRLNIIERQFSGQAQAIEQMIAALDDDAYYFDEEEIEPQ